MALSRSLTITALSLFIASQTMAEETTETERKWKADAEVGFLNTSGNSDTQTLIAKFSPSAAYGLWKHSVKLEALNSSQKNQRSAEKYSGSLQSDYNLSDRSYVFGGLAAEKDRFSGYDYQASIVLGYGYHLIKKEDLDISLEASPGYRVNETDVGNDKTEDAIIRATQKALWKLSESAKIEQSLSSEYGDSNTLTRLKVALSSQVVGALSMKLGYQIKHNSEVPASVKNTDTETSVTLVYTL